MSPKRTGILTWFIVLLLSAGWAAFVLAGNAGAPAAAEVGRYHRPRQPFTWRMCPGCGRVFVSALRYCPFDGRLLVSVLPPNAGSLCSNCRRSFPRAFHFCPFDGAPLRWQDASNVPSAERVAVERFPALAALLDVRAALEKMHRAGQTVWQTNPARLPALVNLLQRLEANYGLRLRLHVRGAENSDELERRLVQLVRLLDLAPLLEVTATGEGARDRPTAVLSLVVDVDPSDHRARAVMSDGLPWFRRGDRARPALLYDGPAEDLPLVVVRRFLAWYRGELERIRALAPGRRITRWEALERQLVYLWATPDFDDLAAQAADLWVQDVLNVSVLRLLRGVPSAALAGAPEHLRRLPIGYQVLRMDLAGRLPLELVSVRDGAELVRVQTRPQPVYIDRWEVSRRQYLRFLLLGERGGQEESGVVKFASGALNAPVDRVTWFDAVNYLQWAGRGLPTAGDWRTASRGAVVLRRSSGRSGAVYAPDDVAATGCVNLLGGAGEWLADPTDRKSDSGHPGRRLAVLPVPDRPGAIRLVALSAETQRENLGFRGALVLPPTAAPTGLDTTAPQVGAGSPFHTGHPVDAEAADASE